MSWESSLSMSPNRPQRNRKRNKLIYYGDDEVSSEDEGKLKKRKVTKITDSPLASLSVKQEYVDPMLTAMPSTSRQENYLSFDASAVSANEKNLLSVSTTAAPDRATAKKIGLRLKNLLKLPKAHKMCIFEWFYSHIDRCLFEGDSDFLVCLKESFPNLSRKGLTRAHWSKIRRIMGKPRRCSEAFFAEERNALEDKRQKIRMLQQRKNVLEDNTTFSDLPKEIPMSLILGTKVTARLRGKSEGLFTGKIDAVDIINSSYRISFERRNVGSREVPDIEVASDEPQETIQLASLIDRKRPFYNAISPMQPEYQDGYHSPPIEYDPVLGQSPARSKLPCGSGGTLGGFPVKFLVQVARLSKILVIKKDNLRILKEMNSQAEKTQSYGETLPIEFQRKYATVVIDLERLNKDLNSLLLGIRKFCSELSPESTVLCDQVSQIQQSAMENADRMVESKNQTVTGKNAVKNSGLTNLVKQLTGIMMQIRFLREKNANPFEFKAITETMNNIKQKITSENMESFQNNVEIHIAHIQSGMNQVCK